MKHAAAWVIVGATYLVAAAGIGVTVRGPQAEGIGRDLAVGLAVLGAGAAVQWAGNELARDGDS